MKIAALQMQAIPGDVDANVARIASAAKAHKPIAPYSAGA